jgi:molybdopterin molybdotransferase
MISREAAWNKLSQTLSPLPVEVSKLLAARGHYLAEPIVADRDWPALDLATMDGYAVCAADLAQPGTGLFLQGEVAAGSQMAPALAPGGCVRIFTGAPLPQGADAVVPVEESSTRSFRNFEPSSVITFDKAACAGQFLLRRAAQARKDEVLIPAATLLHARHLGVAASCGCALLKVYRKPRVVIFNTGEELRDVGAAVLPHEIRNAGGPLLHSLMETVATVDGDCRIIKDCPHATYEALGDAARTADIVIVTGGVSQGRYDYVAEAVARIEGSLLFHGVTIKPGKPTLAYRTRAGGLIFGLPGNPMSCLVAMYEFVLPAVRRLAGCEEASCQRRLALPLNEKLVYSSDRQLMMPALMVKGEKGLALQPQALVGSADLVTGCRVDGMMVLPGGDHSFDAGAIVAFSPWCEGG